VDDKFLYRKFSGKRCGISARTLRAFGYDWNRGRMDLAAPF
jgi:hypothetical protein